MVLDALSKPNRREREREIVLSGSRTGLAANMALGALAGRDRDIDRMISMEPRAIQIAAEVLLENPVSPIHVPTTADEEALLDGAHEGEQIH